MKPSFLLLLWSMVLIVGCEIRVPPNAAPSNNVHVPETKTGSYETAEPLGSNAMAAHTQHMNEQMVQQLGESDENYEKRFIDMMIPHHDGAILMSQHALEHANREELKEMARKMIETQQQEIEQLKRYRHEWYGSQ